MYVTWFSYSSATDKGSNVDAMSFESNNFSDQYVWGSTPRYSGWYRYAVMSITFDGMMVQRMSSQEYGTRSIWFIWCFVD